jgi:hypothetical protein
MRSAFKRAKAPVRGSSIFPTPAPADYSDEVSQSYIRDLESLVRDVTRRNEGDSDEWVVVDGPAW